MKNTQKPAQKLLNSFTKSGKKKIPVGRIGKLPHWMDTSRIVSWERKKSIAWEEFFAKNLNTA